MNLFPAAFDHIYSLGGSCLPAITLDSLGLRNESMPFDWLLHGSLLKRVGLLSEERPDFPSAESLEPLGDELSNTGHKRYRDRKSGIVTIHDFLPNAPMVDQLSKVREKFSRRFKRIRDRLTGRNLNVLFVWYNEPDGESADDETLKLALDRISEVFPGNRYYLVCMNDTSSSSGLFDVSENIRRIDGDFRTGGGFRQHLRSLRVRGELAAFRRRTLSRRRLAKLLSSLIPISAARKKVRMKLQEMLGVQSRVYAR